jgi:hypothetical protein
MQKKADDEASVLFVSGIAQYLKAPLDGEMWYLASSCCGF